ncbi:MAG TPA: hypothetical protein VHN79_05085 [Lacunisphaera sp.]|nr:hypothetical protein [Lacunisphaera sp.]
MHAVPRDRASIIEAIYLLPLRLKLRGCSLLQLVRETGYPGQAEAIGVEEIRAGLAGCEGIVAVWLEYSRGKDAGWGWYFEGPYQGFFLTGSRTRTLESPVNTRDAAEACACFIKAELDSILGREVRWVHKAAAVPV